MVKLFGIAAGVILITSTIAGVLFSHRIAGPIYKLQKHFNGTAKSHGYSEVRFRKGDFFQELADAYNNHLPNSKVKNRVIPD
jgi:hypothetical protein